MSILYKLEVNYLPIPATSAPSASLGRALPKLEEIRVGALLVKRTKLPSFYSPLYYST